MKSLIITITSALSIALAFFGAKALTAQEDHNAESSNANEPETPAVLLIDDEEDPPDNPTRADNGESSTLDAEPEEQRARELDTDPMADPEPAEDPAVAEPAPEEAPVPEDPDAEPEAQEEDRDPADPAAEEELEPLVFDIESPMEHDGAVRETNDTITVDFPDEEIRTVLRVVAELFDLNIVIGQDLTGRTSVRLRDVTWQQVFDVVLSPVGYTYVEENNIIKVISVEALNREPPITEVSILNHARAENIRAVIEPMVTPPTGRVQVDVRSNALIITERPTQMRRLREIIEELDQSSPQVMIESKFVETTNEDMSAIGIDWTSLDAYQLRAGPFEHSYARDSWQQTTTDHTTRSSSSVTSEDPVTSTSSEVASETTGERGRSTDRLTTAVFSADSFDFILSALNRDTDAKLVSNPTVVTMDNQAANIHIGQKYPLVLPRYNPQTGTYEADDAQFIPLGISLDVTPQVNAAGYINLQVEPKVSRFGGTVSYFNAEYPIEETTEASSNVTIRDGYTLALGGLVEDDIRKNTSKVPVLGDLPLLGRLFRHDRDSNFQRNLIIFITAQTVSPDGTYRDIVDPRQTRRMGLTEEDIPGSQYRPDISHFPEVEVIEEEPRREAIEEPADPRAAPAEPVTEAPDGPLRLEEPVDESPDVSVEEDPRETDAAVDAEPREEELQPVEPEESPVLDRDAEPTEPTEPAPAPEEPVEAEPESPADFRSPEARERAERLRQQRR